MIVESCDGPPAGDSTMMEPPARPGSHQPLQPHGKHQPPGPPEPARRPRRLTAREAGLAAPWLAGRETRGPGPGEPEPGQKRDREPRRRNAACPPRRRYLPLIF